MPAWFRRGLAAALLLIAAVPPAAAQGFSGAGSTLAYPLIAQWGRAFATLEGEGGGLVHIDGGLAYEAVGSVGGVTRLLAGGVEFGASDVPLEPAEVERNDLAQFPIALGGIAVVTNLRGVPSGALRLNGAVVARLYLGEITRWNDPAIAALNPGLPLPDTAVVVTRRQDGSGTTWHFARHLAAASTAWRDRVGVDTTLNWPTGQAARGNEGVATLVQNTPNAIGYVEAGLATRLNLAIALIENSAGRFVAPGFDSLQAAAATVVWDPARHFHAGDLTARSDTAYPITAAVYVLMSRRPAWPTRARRALNFFRFALTERAADATALGFVPVPEPVVREVQAYWRARLGAR